jgi:hypothetical protein
MTHKQTFATNRRNQLLSKADQAAFCLPSPAALIGARAVPHFQGIARLTACPTDKVSISRLD